MNNRVKTGIRGVAILTLMMFSWESAIGHALPQISVSKPLSAGHYDRENIPEISLEIPEDLARIEKTYQPRDGLYETPVILIQDSHADREIQMKIRDIVQYIHEHSDKQLLEPFNFFK